MARPAQAEDPDRDFAPAAVEFRRLAGEAVADEARAAWYWMAGRAYLHLDQPARAESMLDRMDESGLALKPQNSLLRAETARASGDSAGAAFYYQSAATGLPDDDTRRLARLRLAEHQARAGDLDAVRESLRAVPDSASALAALDTYRHGHDKSPRLGGVLGLVPGLGYAYSGEKANALRCLILNSIFIYGMARFAEDDQWGGFAVVTFFELTWYSGSIYGGMDAAHRHNQCR